MIYISNILSSVHQQSLLRVAFATADVKHRNGYLDIIIGLWCEYVWACGMMMWCDDVLWVCAKREIVLGVLRGDRLDFPAGVIRSLSQADPFPCSVTCLGRTDLFKALDFPACAGNPMATRNLIRAPGKREVSSSPLPLGTPIQPRCLFTGYTPALTNTSHSLNTSFHLLF